MDIDKKEFRKALKGPDRFQTTFFALAQWLTKNKNKIYFALIPLICVIAIFFGWQRYQQYKFVHRQDQLAAILFEFNEEEKQSDKKRETIRDQINNLEKDEKNKAQNQEVIGKLEQELGGIKADHGHSLDKFIEFYQKNKANIQGWQAGLKAVALLTEQKKFNECLPILEHIVKHSKQSLFFQIQSRLLYMGILEELGQYDQALVQAEEFLKTAPGKLQPQILLMKGRLLVLKNAQEEAKKTFDSLIKDFQDSPEAQKAQVMKALIN